MFCANDIHILSSRKKIEFLRPLEPALAKKDDLPNLQLYTRNKVLCVCVCVCVCMCVRACVRVCVCGGEGVHIGPEMVCGG